jgi:hypothetical protein
VSDWNLFWGAVSAITAGAGVFGGGVAAGALYVTRKEIQTHVHDASARLQKDFIDKQTEAVDGLKEEIKEHIALAMRAELAEHENRIIARVNGAYMRTPEQRAINESLGRRIDDMNGTLTRFIEDQRRGQAK